MKGRKSSAAFANSVPESILTRSASRQSQQGRQKNICLTIKAHLKQAKPAQHGGTTHAADVPRNGSNRAGIAGRVDMGNSARIRAQ